MWNRLLLLKVQLLSHEGIRRYGANTAWLMGEKVLRMFMGLFVGIWVARYLGPEQFGLLSYAQSFVFLFTAIATLGLDSIVVRELVKDQSQRNVLLGTAFALKLIGSLCILPLLWLGVQFTSNDSYTNLLIFIIASGTIFQSFNVIDFYYQSSVLSKYVAFANTITLAISSIVKVVLILNDASLLAFAIVGVFDAVILSLGLIYFYWQKTQHSLGEWQFDKVMARRLLGDSWPLILSGAMVSFYMRVDQIMIKYMLSSQEVGYYSSAVRLNELWIFIPAIVCTSVFPAIINYKAKSEFSYSEKIDYLYTLMIWLSILVVIFSVVFSRKIILLTFGSSYLPAVNSYNLLVLSNIFIFFTIAWSRYILVENNQKSLLYFDVFSVFINIVLNIFIIPIRGIEGAAIATTLSVPTTHAIIFLFWKDQRYILKKFFHSLIFYYK